MRFALALLVSLLATQAHAQVGGTYTFPVKNEALRPYATFEIPVDLDRANPSRLEFPLPTVLTGVEQTVILSELRDGVYAGPKGDANCSSIAKSLTCEIRFKNLESDLGSLRSILESQFPIQERASRLAVAEAFMSEPIGIFSYDYNKINRGQYAK